jgi:flavin reductase (DIM6/NTAB) family NADH-FMN oxidoreductase RutF
MLPHSVIICMLLWFICLANALRVTPTPPLLDSPVYSLATLNSDGTTNMNVLTYATPVSVRPSRIWSLGLYKETQSYVNFCQQKSCILQLLTERDIPLIKPLGGTSSADKSVDKETACRDLGCEWISLPNADKSDPNVLPDCVSYLKLTLQGDMIDCGSHVVAVCQVDEMYASDDAPPQHLTTSTLRDLGIITAQGRVAE